MLSCAGTIKAQLYETGARGIVWHGNYVRFLEQARCALLDRLGYNYEATRDSGYAWPIVDLRIKYVRRIRFGQEFTVEAMIVEFENGLKIDYRARDPASGEVLTKARTVQVPVRLDTGEMLLESPPDLTGRVR